MQNDSSTCLAEIREVVREFVAEREWEKFHSPKNISMALAIEAAELMEHFQWLSLDESRNPDVEKKVAIGEEMSDVLCYLLALANTLDVDLASSLYRKMELNRKKYPVDRFKGRFGADDPASVSSNSIKEVRE